MTVVAVQFQDGKFLCCSDTKISRRNENNQIHVETEVFSKSFVIHGTFEIDYNSVKKVETFSFGVAFAGGALISSAIAGLIGNILSCLKNTDDSLAPSSKDLIDSVELVATLVLKDFGSRKTVGKAPTFSFAMFGFCPRIKEPFLTRFTYEDPLGLDIIRNDFVIRDGYLEVFGSGSMDFEKFLKSQFAEKNAISSLPSLMAMTLATSDNKTIGGGITLISATKDEISIVPVLFPQTWDQRELNTFVSVSGISEFGIERIGSFSFTRNIVPAGSEMVLLNQFMIAQGFDLDKRTPAQFAYSNFCKSFSVDDKNARSLHFDLNGETIEIFTPLSATSSIRNYSCTCPKCDRDIYICDWSSELTPIVPMLNGRIVLVCPHCNALINLESEKITKRP